MASDPRVPLSPVACTLKLRRGVTLRLRPIRPDDDWRLAEMLNAADHRARRQRFPNGSRGAVSAAQLQGLTQVDQRRHVAWVVTLPGGPFETEGGGDWLVAEGRYRIAPDGCNAELALMVADAWQRQGIGRWLLRALASHAGQAGVRALHAELSASDTPAVALLQHCHFRCTPHPHQPRVLLLSASPARAAFSVTDRVRQSFDALAARARAGAGAGAGFAVPPAR